MLNNFAFHIYRKWFWRLWVFACFGILLDHFIGSVFLAGIDDSEFIAHHAIVHFEGVVKFCLLGGDVFGVG